MALTGYKHPNGKQILESHENNPKETEVDIIETKRQFLFTKGQELAISVSNLKHTI